MTDTILRLPDVKAKTKLSRSTIYYLIKKGKFPKQIKLSTRASGWKSSEIEDWIKNLKNAEES